MFQVYRKQHIDVQRKGNNYSHASYFIDYNCVWLWQ